MAERSAHVPEWKDYTIRCDNIIEIRRLSDGEIEVFYMKDKEIKRKFFSSCLPQRELKIICDLTDETPIYIVEYIREDISPKNKYETRESIKKAELHLHNYKEFLK